MLLFSGKKPPVTDEENRFCTGPILTSTYGAIRGQPSQSQQQLSSSDGISSRGDSEPEEEGGKSSVIRRKKRRMEQKHCCKPMTSNRLTSILNQNNCSGKEDGRAAADLVLPALDPK